MHVSTDVQIGKTKKENRSPAYPQIPPCQSLRPRQRLQARRLPQSGGNQLLLFTFDHLFIYSFYIFVLFIYSSKIASI